MTSQESSGALQGNLRKLIEDAKERAMKRGKKIIGYVTRVEPVSYGKENFIKIEIPFENYIKDTLRVRNFIGISLPVSKSLMLGRVREVERSDLMAIARIPSIGLAEDPTSLTTPLALTIELISEILEGEVLPPSSPVDPQSPVFIPSDDFIRENLGVPSNGIEVGKVLEGVKEREVGLTLSEEMLRHHILITGTTGSGKTNLLKVLTSSSIYDTSIFDVFGDYFDLASERRGYVLIPISEHNIKGGINRFIDLVLSRSKLRGARKAFVEVEGIPSYIIREGEREFHIIPFSFRFHEIYEKLSEVNTLFSVQGSYFFPIITKKCIEEHFSDPEELTIHNWEEVCNHLMDDMKLANSTKENISRNIVALRSLGIIDTSLGEGRYVGFPRLEKVKGLKVIDLRWTMEVGTRAATIASFILADNIFTHKDEIYKSGGEVETSLLVFDEAHEFFPQGQREENKEALERLINRIMRLGRVRGIATVLATHRPEDLNDLILTLTNTKIALRSDESSLRKIQMEEEAKFLESSPPGFAVMKTFAYKVNKIYFKSNKYG
jgi:DNA helicase HerA-like ATPase